MLLPGGGEGVKAEVRGPGVTRGAWAALRGEGGLVSMGMVQDGGCACVHVPEHVGEGDAETALAVPGVRTWAGRGKDSRSSSATQASEWASSTIAGLACVSVAAWAACVASLPLTALQRIALTCSGILICSVHFHIANAFHVVKEGVLTCKPPGGALSCGVASADAGVGVVGREEGKGVGDRGPVRGEPSPVRGKLRSVHRQI